MAARPIPQSPVTHRSKSSRASSDPGSVPFAQPLDHALEIVSSVRQGILDAVGPETVAALDDAAILEMPETRHEQRARDPWEPALDLVEMLAAGEQLTHNQWRPAIG
jgi:hypothetical protein